MELDHLHVAQRQTRAQRHGETVHALVAGRRVIAVHGRAAAGRQQHGLRRDEAELAGADVDHQHAGERAVLAGMSATARCSSRRRIGRAHTCSISRLMISMPVRSPLCTVRSKVWPAKALPCRRAVGVAIEEAADLVLQLAHALDRGRHQRPGQLLVRQPFAALDGVHEMALDRIAGIERHVVAALHHAGAAALAEQALAGDRDVESGIGREGMQRREQPGAAGAEDQNVGLQAFEGHVDASEYTCEEDEGDKRRHRPPRWSPAASGRRASRDSRSPAAAAPPTYAPGAEIRDRSPRASPAAGRSSAESFPAALRRRWRARASGNAAAGKPRAPGRRAGAPAPRARARCCDARNRTPSWQHHRGDRPQPEHEQASIRARSRMMPARALAERRPFDQDIAHADGGMNGNRDNEDAVEARPGDAAAGAAEDVRGASFPCGWRRR